MSSSILMLLSLFMLVSIYTKTMTSQDSQPYRNREEEKRYTTPIDFQLTHDPLKHYEVTDDAYWMKHKRTHNKWYHQCHLVDALMCKNVEQHVIAWQPNCGYVVIALWRLGMKYLEISKKVTHGKDINNKRNDTHNVGNDSLWHG
eukprot:273231_1